MAALVDTQNPTSASPLLEVQGLKKYFPIKRGLLNRVVSNVKAVDGISFSINAGETFGLVGESGCGKSTTGRVLLRLQEPTAGSVKFEGQELFNKSTREMREMRRQMQIIFQDPFGSLNPRFTVGDIIGEPLRVHNLASGAALDERVSELMNQVGLKPDWRNRFPHEFSGGQRQRIGIARAIAMNPKFIVCDEAVSALDVSVQAQIVNLLMDLQEQLGLTYLFIAHGLAVVRHICNRIGVMYKGRLVELAETDELFAHPTHPYTQSLLSAIPIPNPRMRNKRITMSDEALASIKTEGAELREIAPGHWVAGNYSL